MSDNLQIKDNEFEDYLNNARKINSQGWEKAMDQKLKMADFSIGDYDPVKNILEKDKNEFGVFVNDEEGDNIVTISKEANPYQGICFGFIDCFVRVSSNSSFNSGTLILRFDPKKLGKVERDTLRLFKWNEDSKFYELIEPSVIGKEGDYVWGIITSPGIYTIIGLNSEPSFKKILKIISENTDQLKTLKPEKQREFLYEVSKTELGPDDQFTKAFQHSSEEK